ncbi:MAG TPA: histidine kinase [Steroidobacteraceae bacterium]|nr:histidine kinase [Steroidobacteraceae bacterium]
MSRGPKGETPHRAIHIQVFSALFWTAMFAMHTLQTALVNQYTEAASILWRAGFSVLGFVLCLPLGWILRRTLGWSLRYQALVVALVCVPLAITYATLGHLVWLDLLKHTLPYSALTNIALQSLYNLVLFLMWAGLCAAILYAARLREKERSLLEARALAHQAELQMLRYQINPHFLFNTLNAVSALVVTGQVEAADQVIAKLARFFRNALSREATAKVSLAEEIRVQAEYLDIELTRFGDRLRFTTAIADGLDRAMVPHLILQPLIENAVKHGVARMSEAVAIKVRATQRAGTLLIAVENDAPVRPILRPGAGPGVGLANVGRRLTSFYGGDGALAVVERMGSFTVELSLPLELAA